MLKEHNRTIRKFQLVLDLAIAVVSFVLAHRLRALGFPLLQPMQLGDLSHYLFLLYIILPLWTLLFYYNASNASIRIKTLFMAVVPALKMVFIGGAALMAILFVFKMISVSRGFLLVFLGINAILMSVERISVALFLRYIRKNGRNYRTLVIIGTGARAMEFARKVMDHGEWGLRISGFVDIEPRRVGRNILGRKVIGLIDDLPHILTKHQIDEVVFIGPKSWYVSLETVALSCETIGIKMRMACDFLPTSLSKIHIDSIADLPLLTLSPPPDYGEFLVVKRAVDVVFSSLILVLASPLLLLIALGIKLTTEGSVFYKQERAGLNGRRFKIYKFRTMVRNADAIKDELLHLNEMSGPVFKASDDPRVTPLGRFLRKFSLDELPQFFNVLKGDMSVVGPRPLPVEEAENTDYAYRRRMSVKPGITCLWQVNGRNKIGFSDWVKLDLEYIDNWSLYLDFKIMVRTVPAVLRGTGL